MGCVEPSDNDEAFDKSQFACDSPDRETDLFDETHELELDDQSQNFDGFLTNCETPSKNEDDEKSINNNEFDTDKMNGQDDSFSCDPLVTTQVKNQPMRLNGYGEDHGPNDDNETNPWDKIESVDSDSDSVNLVSEWKPWF